jgi:GDP-fucose transporter C1
MHDLTCLPRWSLCKLQPNTFFIHAYLLLAFRNKAVLNRAPELPLVFLLNQLLIAVVLLHVAARLTPRVEIPAFEWGTARKLAPCVVVNIVGLVFNTLCLREVDASFFQVCFSEHRILCSVDANSAPVQQIARGLQLPLTIFVSALTMCSAPSPRVILAAAMVTAGFFIGVAPSSLLHTYVIAEPPSLISLTYGVLSSLMIALHAVLIKSALPHVSGSAIQLAYWTNAGSAALVLPFVLFNGELGLALALSGERTRVFVVGSVVTGVFGFLLCVAGLLSIKVTSPVTHMFSSVSGRVFSSIKPRLIVTPVQAARTVLQTLLGVGIFGDLMTV